MNRIKYELEVTQEEPNNKLTEWIIAKQVTTISYKHTLLEDVLIPLTIFTQSLSPLKALVNHLKTTHKYSTKLISNLLCKSYHSIWLASKQPGSNQSVTKSSSTNKDRFIPLNIFYLNNLSILEAITFHLQKTHSLSEIARMLKRDPRTIWTLAFRAKKKLRDQK